MMSLGTATAFASGTATDVASAKINSTTILGSAKAYFDFTLARGANSSSSDLAYKSDTTAAAVYPQSGWLPSQDIAYFRVRNSSQVAATGLATRNNLNSFNMSYLSGYNTTGYKYLYASAPSSNPDPYVWVGGAWYP